MSFDLGTLSGIGIASVVVGGAILGRAKWVVDHEIRDQLRSTQAELRPNGGQSFRDHLDQKLDSISRHFNERISDTQLILERQAKVNADVEYRLEVIDRRLDDFDRRRRAESDRKRFLR